ncbi:anaphase promoting complex subunit 4 apc4 [Anaeramoeba flamelloides]|uniref:Anaphase promoting complex subunit 4 apc4 n=1 Tax=Anaeramoeba flamelloides TaxID=1746091 RepID=A0AAV7Z0S9_9EUKA|nr:anaphase promoting complex subunit 4 apc4 [Anaeramoeba flamelloides]
MTIDSKNFESPVTAISWSSDGKLICIGTNSGYVHFYNYEIEEITKSFKCHDSCIKILFWETIAPTINEEVNSLKRYIPNVKDLYSTRWNNHRTKFKPKKELQIDSLSLNSICQYSITNCNNLFNEFKSSFLSSFDLISENKRSGNEKNSSQNLQYIYSQLVIILSQGFHENENFKKTLLQSFLPGQVSKMKKSLNALLSDILTLLYDYCQHSNKLLSLHTEALLDVIYYSKNQNGNGNEFFYKTNLMNPFEENDFEEDLNFESNKMGNIKNESEEPIETMVGKISIKSIKFLLKAIRKSNAQIEKYIKEISKIRKSFSLFCDWIKSCSEILIIENKIKNKNENDEDENEENEENLKIPNKETIQLKDSKELCQFFSQMILPDYESKNDINPQKCLKKINDIKNLIEQIEIDLSKFLLQQKESQQILIIKRLLKFQNNINGNDKYEDENENDDDDDDEDEDDDDEDENENEIAIININQSFICKEFQFYQKNNLLLLYHNKDQSEKKCYITLTPLEDLQFHSIDYKDLEENTISKINKIPVSELKIEKIIEIENFNNNFIFTKSDSRKTATLLNKDINKLMVIDLEGEDDEDSEYDSEGDSDEDSEEDSEEDDDNEDEDDDEDDENGEQNESESD